MQDVRATDSVLRRALRAGICPTCPFRPQGSESMGWVARSCEGTCTIFGNLNSLVLVAIGCAENPSAGFERLIRDQVCQQCNAVPTAGDYCSDRLSRTCPLSVQMADVLAALEPLVHTPVAKK
jgi:hypothetical protein